MVSSINSVRIWTQQTALKAFNETSSDSGKDISRSSVASLADMLYADVGGADEDEDTDLSNLIASLQQQAMTGGAGTEVVDDGAVDDIASNAFMKALQQKIEGLAASGDTKVMAEAMLAALSDGRLTVTDAEAGERIVGRDVTAKADAAGTASTADTPETSEIASVTISDWSTYLRDHLLRDPYGKYVRNDDSSHRDKLTGASSYFGMIGETYYYLSWTSEKASATEDPAKA